MKKLTTAIMVLTLVLGGVVLAMAAELPQAPKNLDLTALQKITDHEAQEIRGMASFGHPGLQYQNRVDCVMPCQQIQTDTLTSALQTQTLMQSTGGKGDILRTRQMNMDGSCKVQ